MAAGRPPKRGIEYAGWSVDMFDNDTDMDKLIDAQGWNGFAIYFYLCQRAYGGEGYFYKWCYDDCATTARKMGGGVGAGTVKETVGYCLQIGLFNKGLFDRWGILTSRGIQSRYCEAIKNRRIKEVFADYWLLRENEECAGLIKLPLKNNLLPTNANLQEANSSLQATNGGYEAPKERKGKERKVNNNLSINNPLLSSSGREQPPPDESDIIVNILLANGDYYSVTRTEVTEWQRFYPDLDVEQEFRNMAGWLKTHPERRKSLVSFKQFANNWLMRAMRDKPSRKKEKSTNDTLEEWLNG